MKILMIDDSRVFEDQKIPKQHTVKLVNIVAGYEDLESKIKGQRYDAILLDINLRGSYKTGINMIKDILNFYSEAIIIMYSSHTDWHLVKHSIEYGAKGYIAKDDHSVSETISIVEIVVNRNKSNINALFYVDDTISNKTFSGEYQLDDEERLVLEYLAKDYTPQQIEDATEGKKISFTKGQVDTIKKRIGKKAEGQFTTIKMVLWGIKMGYISPFDSNEIDNK